MRNTESQIAIDKREAWLEHLEAHGRARTPRPAGSRADDKALQRWTARAKGMCGLCCTRYPEPGFKTCEECLRRARVKRKEERRLARLARAAGLG